MELLALLGIFTFVACEVSLKIQKRPVHVSCHYDEHIFANYIDDLSIFNPPCEDNEMISKELYFNKVYNGICVPAYKEAGEVITKERQKYIFDVLNFLYDFCSTRKYELAAVTALVMHNTSYLRVFEGPGYSEFRPRGIFQIYGKENYELLEKISFFYHDYSKVPERAGFLNIHVLVDLTCFWLHISYGKKTEIGLDDALEICNSVQWRVLSNKWNYTSSVVKDAEEKYKIQNELYEKLRTIIYVNYYRN
ncbi:hypothetical protein EHEL_051140 [Encephalitozoon hellem ATCC 50504]|uniref:Uncharacterized protein n=1 Tax=Encephalitozoon hellem TaxID=27973 RepID=A0A9Q9C9X4_ENCHE|nr:uncharacterized protein EHEL_051140 [Encephalitozoon hellem ATCC 50504]AFM98323.1 hypothetical protein EHEL_051140 [Encephalitozoon hellem ATCC 50504]UTX43202.1 hypothetical protein GPU96_05g09430 [Encephalitozoon hellem]WEL38659.1 hypothetical protein PFJ87_05g01290 [Encephalitozoon hellem]|eukprot:XP_003887304.1 hypothetical protein EHEL_051140 [Encephalitozoon hellem ATCC 50504]